MWKIAAEKGGRIFDLFKEESLVAMGRDGVGDISSLTTRQQVAAKVQEAFTKWPQGREVVWAGMLFRFQQKIGLDDYVITYDPGRRKYLIGTIASECRFDPRRIPGDGLQDPDLPARPEPRQGHRRLS
jgi:restriction system protein